MRAFEWVDATSVEQAVSLLTHSDGGTVVAKAVGMDLLDLMKEGIVAPSRVVNLRTIGGLDGITLRPSGELEIGALVTLESIESAVEIRVPPADGTTSAYHKQTERDSDL